MLIYYPLKPSHYVYYIWFVYPSQNEMLKQQDVV